MRFEVSIAVKICVMALWAKAPCSLVYGYQNFGGI
jgi:hypothetical protein